MLSGEAHYRQQRNKTYENFNQIQKDGSSNVGSEFLEFLDFDISKAKNKVVIKSKIYFNMLINLYLNIILNHYLSF